MIYLSLSIFFNALIYFIFKGFEINGVRTFPALVFNYITASTIGLFMVSDLRLALLSASVLPTWTMGGLTLGFVFISVFYLTAITAQRVGMSVTSLASKMSMALAVVLLFFFTNDTFGWQKGLALFLALTGVVFASMKRDGKPFKLRNLGWPLIILVGSALVDFGLAFFPQPISNQNDRELFMCLPVAVAASCGVCILIFQTVRGTYSLRFKEVIAGVILGLINYGSIYFLVLAYHQKLFENSTMLCINNLGVVLLTALVAVLFFKEKLNGLNYFGIGLAAIAILLLAFA